MIKRVLVADDSETIQKAISIALAPFDVEIFVAASYVDTLGECRKHMPQLLIVDASLTGTDGTHDFQNLAAAAGGVPMLLLEGSYEPIDRAAFAALGLRAFLKKPFDSQALFSQLRDHLGVHFAQRPVSAPPKPPLPRAERPLPPANEFEADVISEVRLHLQQDAGAFAPPPAPRDRRPLPPSAPSPAAAKMPAPPPPPALRVSLPSAGLEDAAVYSAASQTLASGPAHAPLPTGELDEEIKRQVHLAVQAYCEQHFRDLAREVLAEELRRLADERSRHFIDN